MKNRKGNAGYLQARRKELIIKAVLEFGIVLALLGLGIWQTGTKRNLLTVVAVLGCLPASKALVEVIMILPHHSIPKETAKEISERAASLTTVFDMVFTSQDHIMPVDSILILNNTLCGYTSSQKTDTAYAEKHIKQILGQNDYTKVCIKIFTDYQAFLKRAGELETLANKERPNTEKKEQSIKRILLNISL